MLDPFFVAVATLREFGTYGVEVAAPRAHGALHLVDDLRPRREQLLERGAVEAIALDVGLGDHRGAARLADLGAEPVPVSKATPDSLRALLKAEVDKWTPIIRKTGVYAD